MPPRNRKKSTGLAPIRDILGTRSLDGRTGFAKDIKAVQAALDQNEVAVLIDLAKADVAAGVVIQRKLLEHIAESGDLLSSDGKGCSAAVTAMLRFSEQNRRMLDTLTRSLKESKKKGDDPSILDAMVADE